MKEAPAFSLKIKLSIIALVLFIFSNAIIGFFNTYRLNDNSRWVSHTLEILDTITDFETVLLDIQSTQRAFVITGEDNYLHEYQKAISSWAAQREKLEELISSNEEQSERLSKLTLELDEWLQLVDETVKTRSEQGFQQALVLFQNKHKVALMNSILRRLVKVEKVEKKFLKIRQMELRQSYLIAIWSDAILAILSLLLLILAVCFRRKDILIQRRWIERLNHQKELYRVTLQSIGDGMIATDSQGNITMMNKVAETATGWTEQEAQGKYIDDIFDLIDEVTHEKLQSPVQRVLETGEIMGLENHSAIKAKNGDIKPVEDSAAPIKNKNGKIVGVVFVFRDISSLETTKRSLELSESRYRALIEASAEIIWTADSDGCVSEDSESWRNFTGQSKEEFLGLGWLDALHPEDREMTKSVWSQCVENEEHYEIEYRLKSAQGEYRITKARGVPVRNQKGEIKEWVGMNIDITDRRMAANKLQENEERFRQIAQLSGDWIWEQEPSGRYTYSNPVIREILGYSPQEILGKHYYELQDETQEPKNISLDQSNQERPEERFFRVKHFLRHKNGQRVVTESSGEPVLAKDGEILKWRGVDRDVTERLLAADRFRTIIEATPVAVLLVNRDGLIDYSNTSAEQLLGYIREDLINKPVENLIPERFRKDHIKYRGEYIKNPKKRPMSQNLELCILTKKGQEIPVEIALTPIYFAAEIMTVVMITDIRERTHREEMLKQTNRNQSNFLAFLGHELRNPLMPLFNAIEIFQSEPPENKRGKWALSVIERQTNDLHHLISDLLDISRIAQGRIELKLEHLDIRLVLDRSIETITPLFEKKNLELKYDKPEQPIFVLCDKIRLAQVFNNLLNNAAKFSQQGQIIILTVKIIDDQVSIEVRDHGIGIEQKDLTRIFELFTSVVDSTIEKTQGLGVGLTLAQQIVEQHGGRISANSDGLGTGCTFTVILPLITESATSDNSVDHQTDSEIIQNSQLQRKVLVVDDHPTSAQTLASVLESKGYEAGYCTTGAEALEKVKTLKPEVIFLDIDLPDINGHDLAKKIRQDFEFRGLLIAISGYQKINDNEDGNKSSHFDHFLLKPLDTSELIRLMNEFKAD